MSEDYERVSERYCVKRVALAFKFRTNHVWDGYVNPYLSLQVKCPSCEGNGTTIARRRLDDLVGLLMASSSEALRNKVILPRVDLLYSSQGKIPGKDVVELTSGLAGRAPDSPTLIHDGLDRYSAVQKIIRAAGLDDSWGICPNCKGDGVAFDSEETRQRSDQWKRTEPPQGKGYQLWTTAEFGCPRSPVFTYPEGLARYLTEQMSFSMTYEDWLKFIKQNEES